MTRVPIRAAPSGIVIVRFAESPHVAAWFAFATCILDLHSVAMAWRRVLAICRAGVCNDPNAPSGSMRRLSVCGAASAPRLSRPLTPLNHVAYRAAAVSRLRTPLCHGMPWTAGYISLPGNGYGQWVPDMAFRCPFPNGQATRARYCRPLNGLPRERPRLYRPGFHERALPATGFLRFLRPPDERRTGRDLNLPVAVWRVGWSAQS